MHKYNKVGLVGPLFILGYVVVVVFVSFIYFFVVVFLF